jgi:2-keto-3-deoxy-L-fuconate dehydrogenase
MFSLLKKNAVITGAGSGIGKAIAELFAQQGATIYIIELDEMKAAQTCEAIKQNSGRAFVHACDISNQSDVAEVFNMLDGFSILVNCAGIAHVGCK